MAGSSGRYGDVFNPSVGEKAGRVAFASAGEPGKRGFERMIA